MTDFFDHDDDEDIGETTLGPVEKAHALLACFDYIRVEAVDLDIPELDWLLGAARMAVTDYIHERTRPPAALIHLAKARSGG